MKHVLNRFLNKEDGAIAVETALITPVLIWTILQAVDIGLNITTTQKMNNSIKSGIQYIVKGGRDESAIKNIVISSFGQQLSRDKVSVAGYCACVQASSGNEQTSSTPVTKESAIYIKTATQVSDNMCMVDTCDSSSPIKTLIEVGVEYEVKGATKKTNLSSKLQTRVN